MLRKYQGLGYRLVFQAGKSKCFITVRELLQG